MLLACYRDLIMVWYCDSMREISPVLLLINSLFISCFWFVICHLLAKLFPCCRDFLKSVCLSLRVFPFLDSSLSVPSFHLVSVVSHLEVAEFARELIELPDQEAVGYVHNGLQHSFSVGVPA